MDSTHTTYALYALGAAAFTGSIFKIKTRLDLSRAKHRSLSGHSKMSRRIAALIPFYEYSGDRFFSYDDAPPSIIESRRIGFERLSALYRHRYPETVRLKIGRAHV